jgi:RNA polymerase sigma-70 factor (ECF subfamily)
VDELELIEQSKLGRVDAFNQLVLLYQTQVYNLALRMLSDTAAAEDIAQDVFISAYRNLRTFVAGNLRAWLLRITSNACRDYLRSARVRRSVSLDAMLENPSFAPTDSNEAPEDYTLRHELAGVIQNALFRIPSDQRLAVVLVDVQGLTYEESSEVMKVPVGTVKSRLNRARSALRGLLAEQQELLPKQFRSGK